MPNLLAISSRLRPFTSQHSNFINGLLTPQPTAGTSLIDKNHLLTRTRIRTSTTKMTDKASAIELCKARAAQQAVNENIVGDCIVGIGSGSTMSYVLESLEQRSRELNLSIKCIPTSFQSKQLIHDYNLPITDIDCEPKIDVAIDGADEVDGNFVAIKGGGACLAQEKVVAFAARKFVVVADYRKDSKHLGDSWKKGIPIEVLPMACNAIRHHIADTFNTKLENIVIRIGKEKAGPVITDNGNMILDWAFNYGDMTTATSQDWKAIADKLKLIPGVVETGIFANMIKVAYFGQTDGTVFKRIPQ